MNLMFVRIVDYAFGVPLLFLLRLLRQFPRIAPRGGSAGGRDRILLVKFWGIGNIFMMLPAVHALRRKYPSARVDLLTIQRNREAATSLDPFFDGVHCLDTGSFAAFARSLLAVYPVLSAASYDVIVDFEQFSRFSALLAALIGRGRTVGFRTAGQHRHHLYTDQVTYDDSRHMTRSFYALAERAGAGPAPELPLLHEAGAAMRRRSNLAGIPGGRVPDGVILVVVHVGTSDNFPERRWPSAEFAKLMNTMLQRKNILIACTGVGDEAPLVKKVLSAVRDSERVLDLCGRLSFSQYLQLVLSCDLVVSADTASVHMASAFGIPVLGIYGPNTPLVYGPWGRRSTYVYRDLGCSPCITNFNAKAHTCRHPDGRGACMAEIKAEAVFRTIEERYLNANAPYRLQRLGER
jgi:ADP-heptose:LPS heptosyltransferase